LLLIFKYIFQASRELYSLAVKTPLCPGDPGWPLGTLFPRASSAEEAGSRTRTS